MSKEAEYMTDEVKSKLKGLKKQIKEDGWMADTERCLKEDVEESSHMVTSENEIKDVGTLLQEFEAGWEETLHFNHYYREPLRKAIKNSTDLDREEIMWAVEDLKNELWRAYHEENDTYEKAESLIKSQGHEKSKKVS